MTAIEIQVNGKEHCVAGITDGTVAVTLQWTGRGNGIGGSQSQYMGFMVSGLDSKDDEHFEWKGREGLAVGDEVVLRFVDVPKTDPPQKIWTALDEKRSAKEAMVRRLAGELGWEILVK
jgi:hypothetical protein